MMRAYLVAGMILVSACASQTSQSDRKSTRLNSSHRL